MNFIEKVMLSLFAKPFDADKARRMLIKNLEITIKKIQ